MVEIEKTAYPRFSKNKKLSDLTLQKIYTPIADEISLAEQHTKDPINKLRFLILLKSFQKLGYFVSIEKVPEQIKSHITKTLLLPEHSEVNYTNQKTFQSHKQIIRNLLMVNPFDQKAQELAQNVGLERAYRINNLPDLINGIIEELIYNKFELPAFSTLCRIAGNCRITANNNVFEQISNRIPEDLKKSLEELMKIMANNKSSYNEIKSLPKKPTVNNLSDFIAQYKWVLSFGRFDQYLIGITKSKIAELVQEARAIDVKGLKDLKLNRRIALIVCLLHDANTTGADNLIKMFCKIINNAHKQAKRKLENLRKENKETIVKIMELSCDMLDFIETRDQKLLEFLEEQVANKGGTQNLKKLCMQMIAVAKQDHLFLVSQYISSKARRVCFKVLNNLELNSATTDFKIMNAIKFMLKHANHKGPTLNISDLDLSFISAAWEKVIFVKSNNQEVIKDYFEACILSEAVHAFRAGDLIANNADLFAGYKAHLLPKEECSSKINDYSKLVNIPATGIAAVQQLKERLLTAAKNLDDNYPNIKGFTIDQQGHPVLSRPKAKPTNKTTNWLKNQIKMRIKDKHVLDVLCSTNHHTGWANHFHHVSGTASKISNAIEKYILTVFASGTSLGPTQTVKHFKSTNNFTVTPHTLSLINTTHITISNLERAITTLTDELYKYQIVGCWGDGKSCAADGTLRNIYEDNLLAEYHLRYGARGGIAYYHVANNYIAFFASFIPCGVWEAIAIIEGLLQNKSKMQPDTVHADTQGQSAVVFALTYLLGIKLMPRIRNWKEYTMFKADKKVVYSNIESLFTRIIDWELIEECWEDFMQLVLSIKAGAISTTFLLQQLTNYARKNKLLKGLQELGHIVRTLFLIEYLSNIELRAEITATTNKVENFNGFSDWFRIGDKYYIVASNDPREQEKAVKCNLLIASAMMLQNVIDFTNIILELQQEGHAITQQDVAGLSPYITEPFKRFGIIEMDYQEAAREISEKQHKMIWKDFLTHDNISGKYEYQNLVKNEQRDEKDPS